MKIQFSILFSLLLISSAASAQQSRFEVTALMTSLQAGKSGELLSGSDGDLGIRFRSKQSFGIAASYLWSDRISTELGITFAQPSSHLFSADESISIGQMRMMPLTAAIQIHLLPHARIDPYLGGGLAYTRFSGFESDELRDLGVRRLQLEDKVGYLLNAGIRVRMTSLFSLRLDGKYTPIESSISADGEDPLTLELDPLLISAGISLHF